MNHVNDDATHIELRVTGILDLPVARRLCDDIISAARTTFVVDLAQSREVRDDALAHLARAVALLRGRVALRGLNRHHARLIHYLGAGAPRPVRREDASEAVGMSA